MAQGRRYVFDPAQTQHSYHQVPQRRQQLRRRFRSHLALVLTEGHVPHPVQPVFDPPVSPPYAQQPVGVRPLRRQAGDGVGEFHRLFALVPPGSFHAADLCQSRPAQVFAQGCRCPQPPPFPTVSVPALLGSLGKALPPGRLRKQQAHRLFDPRLVVLQDPEIVPPLFQYLLAQFPLAVQGITGYHLILQFQLDQQAGGHPQFTLLVIPPDPPFVPVPGHCPQHRPPPASPQAVPARATPARPCRLWR